MRMAGFYLTFLFLLSAILYKEVICLPFPNENTQGGLTRREFRGFIPKTMNVRVPRAEGEGEGQSGGSGIGEMINTAIQGMAEGVLNLVPPFILDGISATSAFDSPTMFIGGFSVMMQPMPNGTEFAGQLMQMAPHYMNLLPGAGRK